MKNRMSSVRAVLILSASTTLRLRVEAGTAA